MSLRKNILRFGLLLMLSTSFTGFRSQAQQSQQPPAKADVKAAPKQRGPGQELVYQTREAAGEEADENAQFKQSPSVAFIARVTGLSLSNAYFFSVFLNFLVVALAIFWLARKYLPGIFRTRTAAIQKAMREAQAAGEEARRRLADIENRLLKLDSEIGKMRESAETEAAAEEARIRAAVQEDARKIVETAQQEIESAAKAARRQLTAYAADLAVGLAQKQLRIDAATDQALLRNFAGELGNPKVTHREPGKDGN